MTTRDSREFDNAVDRSAKTAIAGALLMAPIAIGAAIGVPEPLMLAYLIIAAALLAAVILRRRSGHDSQK